MDEAKLQKLSNILEQIDNDYVTEPQLNEVVEIMTKIVKGLLLDLEKKIDTSSGEALLKRISESNGRVDDLSKRQDKNSKEWNAQLSKEVSALRGLIDNLSFERGEKGDPFIFDDLTIEQKEELKGEQGSPDTAEQVRNKLEKLKEDERLDVSAIKGIGNRLAKISESILNRALEILDQRTQFLINKVSNLQTQVNSISTSVGSGSSGSSYPWMPPETPSGLIDSSNLTYQLSYIPVTYSGTLFVNGQYYNEGTDWTISDGVITMTTAIDASLSGLPFWFKGQYFGAVPLVPSADPSLSIQDATSLTLQDGSDILLN